MNRIIVPLGCGRQWKKGVPISITSGYPRQEARERLERATQIWGDDEELGMVFVGGRRSSWANNNTFPIPSAWNKFHHCAILKEARRTGKKYSLAVDPRGFDFVTELITTGEMAERLGAREIIYVGHTDSDERLLALARLLNSNFEVSTNSVPWIYINESQEQVLARERGFLDATLNYDLVLPRGSLDEGEFIANNRRLYAEVFPEIKSKLASQSLVYGAPSGIEKEVSADVLARLNEEVLKEFKREIMEKYTEFAERGCFHSESEKPDF